MSVDASGRRLYGARQRRGTRKQNGVAKISAGSAKRMSAWTSTQPKTICQVLIGTEKQVRYGKSCRYDQILFLERIAKAIRQPQQIPAVEPNDTTKTVWSALDDALIDAHKPTSAKYWIDYKNTSAGMGWLTPHLAARGLPTTTICWHPICEPVWCDQNGNPHRDDGPSLIFTPQYGGTEWHYYQHGDLWMIDTATRGTSWHHKRRDITEQAKTWLADNDFPLFEKWDAGQKFMYRLWASKFA